MCSIFLFQVECKKAQPKEVMLPANLAKTRAAGRTAYGELVVLSGGPTATSIGAVGAPSTSLRYAPYPLPATVTGHQQSHHHHHHNQQQQQQQQQTAHIIPLTTSNPSILQYTTAPHHHHHHHQQTLYDAAAASLSYKRLLAATAAASLRSHHHHHHHPTQQHHHHPRPPTATLTYPLSELLGVQGLDVSALYGLPTATLGL